MNRSKATLFVLIGAISYGVLSTIVKLAYSAGFDSAAVSGSQFFFGWLMIFILALLTKNLRLSPATALTLMAIGISSGTTGYLYYQSLQTVSASVAIILLFQFTWIGVVIDSLLTRRLPSRPHFLSALLLIGGAILASAAYSSALDLRGTLFGLGAAVSFSIFLLASGRVANHVPVIKKSFYMMTGGLSFVMIMYPPTTFLTTANLEQGLIWYALPLGLFALILPPLLFAAGAPHLSPASVSLLGAAELPTAVICSVLILGEHLAASQWIGIVIILIGIFYPIYVSSLKQTTTSTQRQNDLS
ncbi:transporter [Exiguobacterium sp. RIT452]|uniref:EamA family transporter n=1 Tax=Exiguobacterium sp. RIT452 TaxID=2315552 RepID=UPI000E75DD94|nr:DMT family transporter [Exiguobacterium sp. RIT452]RJO97471.1 transporter [Exiguobacterium sp. RIT452]